MTRSTQFLLSASLLALFATASCSAKIGDARYLDWYGFKLGQQSTTKAHPEVMIDNLVGEPVANPPPPWSSVSLEFNATSWQLVMMEFRDAGEQAVVCDVAPCPPGDRLKSISQIRADGKQVRADLEARFGKPTHADTYEALWLFPAAKDYCGSQTIVGKLVPDPTKRLYKISLRQSDTEVALDVVGVDSIPEGATSPPPSPASTVCH